MKIYVVYELLVFEDHQVKREERFFKSLETAKKIWWILNNKDPERTFAINMVVVEDL